MTNTQSEAQSEKEQKQIAKRQKSAAWAITKKVHENGRIFIVLIIFLMGFVPTCEEGVEQTKLAYQSATSVEAEDAAVADLFIGLAAAFLLWWIIAAAIGLAYVFWKSRDYLILPKAELRKKWLELGGFPENPS